MKYYFKKNLAALIASIFIVIATLGIFLVQDNVYEDLVHEITKYDITVNVLNDGSIEVTEKVKFRFTEHRVALYADVNYKKNNNGEQKNKSYFDESYNSYIKIYDSESNLIYDTVNNINEVGAVTGFSWKGDRDERGILISNSTPQNCETFFFYIPGGIENDTTFEYSYRIIGAVTNYNDVSELNWIFGNPTGYIKQRNMTVTVNLPSSVQDTDDIYFYGHGNSNGKLNSITSNKIVFSAKKIYPYDLMEARILLPRTLITNSLSSNNINKDGLNEIVELEDKIVLEGKLQYMLNIVGIFTIIGVAAYTIYIWYKAYNRFDKEHESTFDYEYYRELPAEYAPAVMGYLYNFQELSKNDLSATLMDLIRRKYIFIDSMNESLTDKNANYKLILNKEKRNDPNLKKYESYLLTWFFDVMSFDKETLTLKELDDYNDTEVQALKYLENNKKWNELVKEDARKENFFDHEKENPLKEYSLKTTLILLVSLIGFFIGLTFNVRSIIFTGSISLSCLILLVSYMKTIKRRSIKGNEDYLRWAAFKRFLSEFSHFEDYPMPGIIVWEHYMVYAVSFGIADLVEKQLKLKFKDGITREYQDAYFYRYPYFYSHVSYRVSNNVTRANQTVIKAKAERMNSSSGGRGGFGGRSFGGGGTGFRSR